MVICSSSHKKLIQLELPATDNNQHTGGMHKINLKDRLVWKESRIQEVYHWKENDIAGRGSRARTLGFLLTGKGGSLKMVSRRVTHESDLRGRRGWWLRLQGAQLLVERAWRGILPGVGRSHPAGND